MILWQTNLLIYVVSVLGIGLFCFDHLPPEIVQLCGDVNVTVALNGMYLEMLCVQSTYKPLVPYMVRNAAKM